MLWFTALETDLPWISIVQSVRYHTHLPLNNMSSTWAAIVFDRWLYGERAMLLLNCVRSPKFDHFM